MKIALVTDTYFPRINGVSASTRTFAQEFEKLGHEVVIVAPEYPGPQDAEPRVLRFPSWYLWFDPEDRLAKAKDKPTLEKLLSHKFDIIHTQTPFTLGGEALKWAKQMNAKVVHTYHTLFTAYIGHYLPFIPKFISQPLVHLISRRYCNACDRIVVPSSAMRDELSTYGIRTPIEVIPTGIKLDRFEGRDGVRYRKNNGYESDEPLLLFVGRLGGEKNVDFLIRVTERVKAKVPKVKLLLMGAGPDESRLRALTKELNLEGTVRFLGYLTGEPWRDCYGAASLFVFASVTETQGLVVSEAMAAGTPVVAVGAMGVKDVMASGKGGLTTDLNVEDFSTAVLRMLTEPGFYKQKKAETLDEAKKWSSTAMAQRMLQTYEQILKG